MMGLANFSKSWPNLKKIKLNSRNLTYFRFLIFNCKLTNVLFHLVIIFKRALSDLFYFLPYSLVGL